MLIFLSGVHGVGKTYLGTQVSEKLGFKYATASELIRNELKEQSWTENKCVSSIDRNQEALVRAVNRIRREGVSLILDGHFVLRNKAGEVEQIDSSVFERLSLNQVVLIEAAASVVKTRLEERGTPFEIELIEELMNKELATAKVICDELGVKLTQLWSPSVEELMRVMIIEEV